MNSEQHRAAGTQGGILVRYLTRTHPAIVFVHAVGVLLLSPFIVALEHWLQAPNAGYGDMLRMTLAGSDDIRLSMGSDGPVNPLRSALVWVLRVVARFFVIVGYALPVWAAARLVADALRQTNLQESQDPPSV